MILQCRSLGLTLPLRWYDVTRCFDANRWYDGILVVTIHKTRSRVLLTISHTHLQRRRSTPMARSQVGTPHFKLMFRFGSLRRMNPMGCGHSGNLDVGSFYVGC